MLDIYVSGGGAGITVDELEPDPDDGGAGLTHLWRADFGLVNFTQTPVGAGDAIELWAPVLGGVNMIQAVVAQSLRYIPPGRFGNGIPGLDATPADPISTVRRMATMGLGAIPAPYYAFVVASDPGPVNEAAGTLQRNYLGSSGRAELYQLGTAGPYLGMFLENPTVADSALANVPARTQYIGALYNGAQSFGRINTRAGGAVQGPDVAAGSNGIGGGSELVVSAGWPGMIQAVGICSANPGAAGLELLEAYLTQEFRPVETQEPFPTFGAADVFELDADDLPEADGAVIITDWVDRQSGYVFAPSGSPVMRRPGGPNNHAAVEWDGAGDHMFQADALSWAQPVTIIVEGDFAGTNVGSQAPFLYDGVDAGNRVSAFRNSTGPYAIFAGTAVVDNTTILRPALQAWRHWAGVFDGASSRNLVNATFSTTGNAGTSGPANGLRLGARFTPTAVNRLHGRISWVGGWNAALSQAQIEQVLRYRRLL